MKEVKIYVILRQQTYPTFKSNLLLLNYVPMCQSPEYTGMESFSLTHTFSKQGSKISRYSSLYSSILQMNYTEKTNLFPQMFPHVRNIYLHNNLLKYSDCHSR